MVSVNISHEMACLLLSAGRTTTNEELEEMLEQGNPAVFTQGVSLMHRHFANTETQDILISGILIVFAWKLSK
jgi:hypothetical protein